MYQYKVILADWFSHFLFFCFIIKLEFASLIDPFTEDELEGNSNKQKFKIDLKLRVLFQKYYLIYDLFNFALLCRYWPHGMVENRADGWCYKEKDYQRIYW